MAHVFTAHLEWSGASKGPAVEPAGFSRDLQISFGTHELAMSAAPAYRGDPDRANPEQLFVAALSACQALTYLYLAARAQVTVVAYADETDGQLGLADGVMKMVRVTLRPMITLAPGADAVRARALVNDAHHQCFVANSVTTAVAIEPRIVSGA